MLKAVILIGGPSKGNLIFLYLLFLSNAFFIFFVFYFISILSLIFPTGTRFRPLSLDVPKPLFPVAGLPVVQHHIDACYRLGQQRVANSDDSTDDSDSNNKYRVAEVILLGYYGDDELADFLLAATQSYPSLRIRYFIS